MKANTIPGMKDPALTVAPKKPTLTHFLGRPAFLLLNYRCSQRPSRTDYTDRLTRTDYADRLTSGRFVVAARLRWSWWWP